MNDSHNAITQLNALEIMLSNAQTVQEVSDIRSRAKVIESMAREVKANIDDLNPVVEIRVRCERKAGQILLEMDKNQGELHRGNTLLPRGEDILPTYAEMGINKMQASRWQRMAKIDTDTFEELLAQKTIQSEEISSGMFYNFSVRESSSSELINVSDNNEWYTPSIYIEAAREVMGSIDLDPASSELANKTVNATHIYTESDDGLAQTWAGNVWLNPPYGFGDNNESNQSIWSKRFLYEYESRSIEQGILLVNAVPGNVWFAPLWDYPICFPSKRIRFVDIEGERGQPTHSNALVYCGPYIRRFINYFEQFGVIAIRARAEDYDE